MSDENQSAPSTSAVQTRSRKLSVSDCIALVAVAMATVSIVVSIRSCQQVERSLRLTEREFEESHSTFWTGTVDGKNVLRLVPSNPDVKIQAAWITFPKLFKVGNALGPEGQLRPPDYSVSIQAVRDEIAEMIRKQTKYANGNISTPAVDEKGKPATLVGHTIPIGIGIQQRAVHEPIPLIIECSYVVKGEIRFDRSLYYLPYYDISEFGPGTNVWGIKEITFQELRFGRHLRKEDSGE